MKTKVEINGYEIEIEELDGRIMVKAVREDEDGEEEVVEEFTIETEGQGSQEEGDEDEDEVQGFGQFDGEEEGDFEGQEEGQDEFEGGEEFEDEEDEDEVKLESFQSFVNKRK
jgi:hypothetical protein